MPYTRFEVDSNQRALATAAISKPMQESLGQCVNDRSENELLLKEATMTCMPELRNEDIRRKMLELAIELRYLAADGKLNQPKFAVNVSCLLEECAQAEGSDPGVALDRPQQSAIG